MSTAVLYVLIIVGMVVAHGVLVLTVESLAPMVRRTVRRLVAVVASRMRAGA